MQRTFALALIVLWPLLFARPASACGESNKYTELALFAAGVGIGVAALTTWGVAAALPDDEQESTEETSADWTLADTAAGAGASLLGAVGGGLAGALTLGLVGAVIDPGRDGRFLTDGSVGLGAVGGVVGAWIGAPLGVWTYGRATDRRGSYAWAAFGTALGLVAATAAVVEDEDLWPVGALAIPLGASLAYGLSARASEGAPKVTGLCGPSGGCTLMAVGSF